MLKLKGLYLAQLLACLITYFMTPGIKAQFCSFPWFGKNCMHKCNCDADAPCNRSGTCPLNNCLYRWFGPACQYYDVIRIDTHADTPSYLRDNNILTCNPDATATSFEVTLDNDVQPFLWFRLEVKRTENILNFTTTINGDLTCLNEVKFPSSVFVDVTCDNAVNLKTIRIRGPIVPDVCSFQLSQGRNVALRQNTTQSSIARDGVPSKAVDGNLAAEFTRGTCTHTADESRPWFRLRLNYPHIVFSVRLYNRAELPERLQGFTVQGFDVNNVMVFEYIDTSPPSVLYSVYTNTRIPIQEFLIKAKDSGQSAKGVLTLCEFLVFGETICPEGTYGLWCGEICQCTDNQVCNPVNGVCSADCETGSYGKICEKSCNSNCLGGSCLRLSGQCRECIAGYYGDFCEKDCTAGFFGEKCSSKCPENCAKPCDHVNGDCTCKDNFAGPTCSVCAAKRYGKTCAEQCSSVCVNQNCSSATGECFACPDRHSGKFCEEASTAMIPAILVMCLLLLIFIVVVALCFCKTKGAVATEEK